jgi:hypothetical protein
LAPGDFVRNAKQLVDLLRQLATVAPDPSTAATAHRAATALQRGVVAASAGPSFAGTDTVADAGQFGDLRDGPDQRAVGSGGV